LIFIKSSLGFCSWSWFEAIKGGRVDGATKRITRGPDKRTARRLASLIKNSGLSSRRALLRPIQSFCLTYLPLVTVYFAFGALGLIDITRDMWIKEQLTLSPAELASTLTLIALRGAPYLGEPRSTNRQKGVRYQCGREHDAIDVLVG